MKQFIITTLIFLCAAHSASAQKFLDTLKQKTQGQGTVTVTQSKEIDELVNGRQNAAPVTPAAQPTTANKETAETAAPKEKPTESITRREETSTETTVIDTRKKVMRNSYKVNGYRVQVFAGGNTRNDRIKAEQIRDKMKAAFPDQPIYTHFYSPRWICRMGNFRSYDEANRILKKVKALGYGQACIVKGKISVQY
ncbi:MAG: SPOR domain-containing protein [Prevotella sp.]|nr:SPOR domain-containing protein [Prevotella sp.]